MPQKQTKDIGNVFRKARKEHAELDERFSSMEGAAEYTRIDRGKIQAFETDADDPNPQEVVILADTYRKPELLNYYCANICPVGKNKVPYVERLELDRVTLDYLSTVQFRDTVAQDMIEIAGDGHISDDELPKAKHIKEQLMRQKAAAEAYLLMLEKRLNE